MPERTSRTHYRDLLAVYAERNGWVIKRKSRGTKATDIKTKGTIYARGWAEESAQKLLRYLQDEVIARKLEKQALKILKDHIRECRNIGFSLFLSYNRRRS